MVAVQRCKARRGATRLIEVVVLQEAFWYISLFLYCCVSLQDNDDRYRHLLSRQHLLCSVKGMAGTLGAEWIFMRFSASVSWCLMVPWALSYRTRSSPLMILVARSTKAVMNT